MPYLFGGSALLIMLFIACAAIAGGDGLPDRRIGGGTRAVDVQVEIYIYRDR